MVSGRDDHIVVLGGYVDLVQQLAFVFLEYVHVEVAASLHPLLMGLHRQRQYQPQAVRLIGEHAQHVGVPLDLLVEAFQHVD